MQTTTQMTDAYTCCSVIILFLVDAQTIFSSFLNELQSGYVRSWKLSLRAQQVLSR